MCPYWLLALLNCCVFLYVPFCIFQRQKPPESTVLDYQDTEDPDYQDFRAEASQQRERQLQCFSKAAEAYKQGRKQVASFYAQQVRRWMSYNNIFTRKAMYFA